MYDHLSRALPILVFADIADTGIADTFWADTGTDIADTFGQIQVPILPITDIFLGR